MYTKIGALELEQDVVMWWICWASDLMGQDGRPVVLLWTTCPFTPFFWLDMVSVAHDTLRRTCSGKVLGRSVVPFQKVTSLTWNCWVHHLSDNW